jgi:hypothetical protein
MLRNIGAVVVGLIAGNVWNMALIMLNSKVLFPMAEGADPWDPEQLKAYVASLPAHAFLVVLAAGSSATRSKRGSGSPRQTRWRGRAGWRHCTRRTT